MSEIHKSIEFVLADTYVLYLKTQNYHWNVVGPYFRSYHLLFEEMYQELARAIDAIAEHLRGLGKKAPGSFRSFLALTRLEEATSHESAEEMIKNLAADQLHIAETLKKAKEAASGVGDVVSEDLLTQRLAIHQKNYWMLHSTLADHS